MSASQAKRIAVRQSLAKRLRTRETHWQFCRAYYGKGLISQRDIDTYRVRQWAKKQAGRFTVDLDTTL